jgi:predicted Zn-dependent peptidase
MVSRLQSIRIKADRLNAYEFYFGEPNSFKRDLDRYRQAKPQDVQDWAQKVFTPDARLILRVVPEVEAPAENPRDQRPGEGDVGGFAIQEPITFDLANGVTVHHWQRSELPLTAVALLLRSGSALDPPGKAGLAWLTADMLDEGAGTRGAMEFADALDLLGADFRASSTHELTTVRMSVLRRNFEQALDLFADAIQRPRFDPKEWQRVQSLHVENLARQQDQPRIVAQRVAMRTFFGDGHPYARPTAGAPTSAAAVTVDDAKGFHAQLYRPSDAVFLVAGDLSPEEVKTNLERALGGWSDPPGVPVPAQPVFPAAANTALRVAVVDRPEAVQTVITFVMPGPTYADPQRPKLGLFNTILGGTFTSRLNQNLREEHGYTYGAGSRYAMNPSVGYFTAGSSVRTDVTGASLGEFVKEFAAVRGGDISSEEAGKARATRRMEMVESFSGLQGILSVAAELVRNDRPFSELGAELQAIAEVTETDLNRLAHDAVPLEQGLLVLVGDKGQILPQLGELDLPTPIELTVTGEAKGGE